MGESRLRAPLAPSARAAPGDGRSSVGDEARALSGASRGDAVVRALAEGTRPEASDCGAGVCDTFAAAAGRGDAPDVAGACAVTQGTAPTRVQRVGSVDGHEREGPEDGPLVAGAMVRVRRVRRGVGSSRRHRACAWPLSPVFPFFVFLVFAPARAIPFSRFPVFCWWPAHLTRLPVFGLRQE